MSAVSNGNEHWFTDVHELYRYTTKPCCLWTLMCLQSLFKLFFYVYLTSPFKTLEIIDEMSLILLQKWKSCPYKLQFWKNSLAFRAEILHWETSIEHQCFTLLQTGVENSSSITQNRPVQWYVGLRNESVQEWRASHFLQRLFTQHYWHYTICWNRSLYIWGEKIVLHFVSNWLRPVTS